MTNFDFLLEYEAFLPFAKVAIAAENILHIDLEACVLNCRRALEFAIKWMYSVDEEISENKQDTLVGLINNKDMKAILGEDLWRRLEFIRKTGNLAAHEDHTVTEEQAEVCLENLFVFCDFLAYCYGDHYEEHTFDYSLLTLTPEEALSFVTGSKSNMEKLREAANNSQMEETPAGRRRRLSGSYVARPLNLNNQVLRRIYKDTLLEDPEGIDEEAWIDLFDEYDV